MCTISTQLQDVFKFTLTRKTLCASVLDYWILAYSYINTGISIAIPHLIYSLKRVTSFLIGLSGILKGGSLNPQLKHWPFTSFSVATDFWYIASFSWSSKRDWNCLWAFAIHGSFDSWLFSTLPLLNCSMWSVRSEGMRATRKVTLSNSQSQRSLNYLKHAHFQEFIYPPHSNGNLATIWTPTTMIA